MIPRAATIADGLVARRESIAQAQDRIIDEFRLFDDLNDRYQTLIEFGRRLPPMPVSLRTEQNRIPECPAMAWLAGDVRNDVLHLSAASEATILAGLLRIVVEVYCDQPTKDVLSQPLIVLDAVGLGSQLSSHRRVALRHVLARLHDLAACGGAAGRSAP